MPENLKKNPNPKHDEDISEDYDSKTAKIVLDEKSIMKMLKNKN